MQHPKKSHYKLYEVKAMLNKNSNGQPLLYISLLPNILADLVKFQANIFTHEFNSEYFLVIGFLLLRGFDMVQVSVVLGKETRVGNGVWLTEDGKDFHIYTNQANVVVGHNPTHKDLKFSNPALSFDKDGKATLQYAGEDGKVKFVEVPPEVVLAKLADLLYSLKGQFAS